MKFEESTLEKIGYSESYVRSCNTDGWYNVSNKKWFVVREINE